MTHFGLHMGAHHRRFAGRRSELSRGQGRRGGRRRAVVTPRQVSGRHTSTSKLILAAVYPLPAGAHAARAVSLSAPGGGEGRGEVEESRAVAEAHLTLPPLSAHACVRLSGGASPMRQGPLPLPPEGRRGVIATRITEMLG